MGIWDGVLFPGGGFWSISRRICLVSQLDIWTRGRRFLL